MVRQAAAEKMGGSAESADVGDLLSELPWPPSFAEQDAMRAQMAAREKVFGSAGDEAEPRASGEARPPGLVRVCGFDVDRLTTNQRRLLSWLEENQDQVARDLKQALRRDYEECLPDIEEFLRIRSGDAPFLPRIVTGDELDDLIQVGMAFLNPSQWLIGLGVNGAIPINEERSWGVVIENGVIESVGSGISALVADLD
jgi:hypothetical protein